MIIIAQSHNQEMPTTNEYDLQEEDSEFMDAQRIRAFYATVGRLGDMARNAVGVRRKACMAAALRAYEEYKSAWSSFIEDWMSGEDYTSVPGALTGLPSPFCVSG